MTTFVEAQSPQTIATSLKSLADSVATANPGQQQWFTEQGRYLKRRNDATARIEELANVYGWDHPVVHRAQLDLMKQEATTPEELAAAQDVRRLFGDPPPLKSPQGTVDGSDL